MVLRERELRGTCNKEAEHGYDSMVVISDIINLCQSLMENTLKAENQETFMGYYFMGQML